MCRKSTSPVETNSYTSDGIKIRMDTLCQKSDELGGMAVNDLRIRRGIANLLNPNGMAGSEIVDAPCVSMSLERKLRTSIADEEIS